MVESIAPSPPVVRHLLPENGRVEDVELSIVVPALNEQITVGEFVDWCKEGIQRAGVNAQILIVDSSTDETPTIALAHGAEVLRVPKRGLGRAYIDAIPFIRGKWVIMGDADLTYDFRDLAPFVEEFKKGAEFVMGSRFRGSIEAGAMPALHRYFGTPLTTWILNCLYGSRYSDIHCGMRGITRAALARIDLHSQSWEYASEMVLKAARLGLRTAEVPVKFYKDRKGRLSHHRREGWMSPWIAGWLNLRVMLVHSADSFLLRPGYALVVVGVMLGLVAAGGRLQPMVEWMLVGAGCVAVGYGCIQLGVLARVLNRLGGGTTHRLQRVLEYDRGMKIAGLCFGVGLLLAIFLGSDGNGISPAMVFGGLLMIVGLQTFCFALLLEMVKRSQSSDVP